MSITQRLARLELARTNVFDNATLELTIGMGNSPTRAVVVDHTTGATTDDPNVVRAYLAHANDDEITVEFGDTDPPLPFVPVGINPPPTNGTS